MFLPIKVLNYILKQSNYKGVPRSRAQESPEMVATALGQIFILILVVLITASAYMVPILMK